MLPSLGMLAAGTRGEQRFESAQDQTPASARSQCNAASAENKLVSTQTYPNPSLLSTIIV